MKQTENTRQARTVALNLPEDLERAYPIMKELRTQLTLDDFKRLVTLAGAADGYRLVARERQDLEGKNQIIALMGYRILHDLVHGSHLYVDDLITVKDLRSQGHGAELLRFAEAEARRLGLTGLRLSTGSENDAARRFYEREGWTLRAVSYKKKATTH